MKEKLGFGSIITEEDNRVLFYGLKESAELQRLRQGIQWLSIDEIADRAYQYYEEGRISDSQYDYLSSLIDDLQ